MDGLIALVYARKLYDLAEGPQGPPGQDGEVTNAALEEKLEAYAKLDGYYDGMTVGTAEQLVATTFTEDDAPYNFRTAGGAIDIGDRKQVEGLVGGTVAWNQLVPTASRDYTNTGAESYSYIMFFFRLNASPYTQFYSTSRSTTGLFAFIKKATATGKAEMIHNGSNTQMRFANNIDVVENHYYLGMINFTSLDASTVGGIVAKDIQLIDLTQMFGSTIADYIYSLEQATEGAGVAWFKKLFNKPYYAYNAGQLISVKALRHITRGFNAWDEEWESGRINLSTGENNTGKGIRSKNLMPIVPSTTYHARSGAYGGGTSMAICYYDADGEYISYETKFPLSGFDFTTLPNAHYMRFNILTSDDVTTYNNDICINLHWDGERDGEYEEYSEHIYELDSDLELRGIPKLSAGNDLYYDGDIYEPNGTVNRRYGIVDMGTLSWHYNSTYAVFWASLADGVLPAQSQGYDKAVCSKYPVVVTNQYGTTNLADKNMMYGSSFASTQTCAVVVKDSAYTDGTAFTTAMSGAYLVYELATPTTETADPYNGTQIVDDFGTEEFVDAGVEAGDRDVAIPVGHNSLYQPNLRAKLEMAPNSPDGDGDYIVRQTDGENEYVPLVIPNELPTMPTENGTYRLEVTVSNGTATLAWEAQS